MEAELGFKLDYIGVWNERYWGGADFVTGLRSSLDAAGFAHTQIVIPDGRYDPVILADAAVDAAFNSSFSVVGLHYPCSQPHAEVAAAGKEYWASEDWWSSADWAGAQDWGTLLLHNYVANNMTATIAWSAVWSVYSDMHFGVGAGSGLMWAAQPWSGYYELSPPLYTGAQFTQFTTVGWRFLAVAVGGGSGTLPGGGYYVTIVAPDLSAFTLILESLQGTSPRCPREAPSAPQTLTVSVTGGLPGPGLARKP